MEIPKIIHYCWFGKKSIPEEFNKYIASWKVYFPDYDVKEWNEENFDLNICDYVQEAYKKKKWAFVSDYVRFYVLYEFGGLYFDTDVEVIRSMNQLLKQGAFMGLEPTIDGVGINPGLVLAVKPGLGLYKEIIDMYNSMHFGDCNDDGSTKTVVTITTDILLKKGFKLENKIQSVEGVTVYPVDYFCPLHPLTGVLNITDNTVSIHHYSASWVSFETKIITHIDYKYLATKPLLGKLFKLPFRLIRVFRKTFYI